MAQVNTFCFFSLATLRVLGQTPKAENNYPLSIIGALHDLYGRRVTSTVYRPPSFASPFLDRSQKRFFFPSFELPPPPPHFGSLILVWVIAVHEVSFSGSTTAICLLPAFSLGNMMLMSALSIAYALLCGVLYCFFWTLSYCRGIVLQHCKHLGLDSQRPHTNFIVILLFSKQKPKSVSKTVSHRARFVSPAHIRQGILGSLSLLPVSLVFLSMVCLMLGEGGAWKGGGKMRREGVDTKSLLEPTQASQIMLLASFSGCFHVLRLIHALLIVLWKDSQGYVMAHWRQ